MKWGLTLVLLASLSFASATLAAEKPVTITFQATLYSPIIGLLEGSHMVTAGIYSGKKPPAIWREGRRSVSFKKGAFSLILGAQDPTNNALLPAHFDIASPTLGLIIYDQLFFFPITSIPYAIKSIVAEEALQAPAEGISGDFTSRVAINAPLFVDQKTFYVDPLKNRVGIGTTQPMAELDVIGKIDSKGLLVNGKSFIDTVAWQPNKSVVKTIHTKTSVGIGTTRPIFGLHATGTINAMAYTINGQRIDGILDWQHPAVVSDLYFRKGGNIGIGSADPRSKLDVRGSLRVGESADTVSGNIRWNPITSKIEGFNNTQWLPLTGIVGQGVANSPVFWTSSQEFGNSASFFWDSAKSYLGLGTKTPRAWLTIQSDGAAPSFIASANQNLVFVGANNNIGIGTSTPNQKLRVRGLLDSDELTIGGLNLRLALSTGTFWLRNPKDNSLFYTLGNVGIGRPDPGSLLELSGRNVAAGGKSQNPAMTFSSSSASFTMGADLADSGVFRIEAGKVLGVSTPLFIALEDRLAIGIRHPQANLHVSGNAGVVLAGKFFGSPESFGIQQALDKREPGVVIITKNIPAEGPGTRMLWFAKRAAFRAGHLDTLGLSGGKEWNEDNLGKFSVGFGHNTRPGGAVSAVSGGQSNTADGAYATVLGGSGNSAAGDFSVAGGQRAKALHAGSFVWADSQSRDLVSHHENQFLIRAQGGVAIGTTQTLFNDQRVALTVAGKAVLGNAFVSSPQQINEALSAELRNDLRRHNYINDDGSFTSQFSSLNPLQVDPTHNAYAFFMRTVLTTIYDSSIIKAGIVVKNTGKVAIGAADPGKSRLLVSGGAVHIGLPTATSNGNVVVRSSADLPNIFMAHGVKDNAKNPAMAVVDLGHTGFGLFPTIFTAIQKPGLQVGSGNIAATAYKLPDNTSLGVVPIEPWEIVLATPNVYFPTGNIEHMRTHPGNVGIGTTLPKSAFEISNIGSVQFDTPKNAAMSIQSFTMGINHLLPDVFRVEKNLTLDSASPLLTLKNATIGMGILNPQAQLHVGATALFNGTVRFTPTPIPNAPVVPPFGFSPAPADTSYIATAPTVNVTTLFVNHELFEASGSKWNVLSNNDIFKPAIGSFVGIGTTQPQTMLAVIGTINATKLVVAKNLKVTNVLRLGQLNFRDGGDLASLVVKNGKLVQQDTIFVSDTLSAGSGSGGKIAFWVEDPTVASLSLLAETHFVWTSPTPSKAGTLSLTGNFAVSNTRTAASSFSVKNDSILGTANANSAYTITSGIGHNGFYNLHSRDFSNSKITIGIDSWLGSPATSEITGAKVVVANRPGVLLTQNGSARGLTIDVSKVNVQAAGDRGFKYAALFNGNVGINTFPVPDPLSQYILDVKGTVVATQFNITKRLSVSTINVQTNVLRVTDAGKVGIATQTPKTAIEIIGTVLAKQFKVKGADITNLDIRQGSLVVNTQQPNSVGMGTSAPGAQLEIRRDFSSTPASDYSAQVISANAQSITHNITAVDLDIQSADFRNILGKPGEPHIATGININLSGTAATENAVITGFKAIMNPADVTRNAAAILLGGNVGVNISEPTVLLDILGTIRANNVVQTNLLTKQKRASFGRLDLTTPNVSITGDTLIAKDIRVSTFNALASDGATQSKLIVNQKLNLPGILLNVAGTWLGKTISVNQTVTAKQAQYHDNAIAVRGHFDGVGLGQSAPTKGLVVSNTLTAKRMVVRNSLNSRSIQFHTTGVISDLNGNIGINTSVASNRLHINPVLSSNPAFNSADNTTWQALRVHSTTSTINGIVFVPESGTATDTGAGIAALRTVRGSHLAIITDPDNGLPVEQVRITNAGNVGIGTTAPDRLLKVAGTARFENDLTLSSPAQLNASVIQGRSGSGITIPNLLAITATANVSANVITDKFISIRTLTKPGSVVDAGALFDNGGLFYQFTTSGNLTQFLSNKTGTIPFFNDKQKLTDTSALSWTASSGIFRVGTANMKLRNKPLVDVVNTIPSKNLIATPFTAHSIRLSFLDRPIDASSQFGKTLFAGLNINLPKQYIPLTETARGLAISVVSLNAVSSTPLPSEEDFSIEGRKFAASFVGGAVAIIASPNVALRPSADLMVVGYGSHMDALRIGDGLAVDPSGRVGIGTTLPTAKTTIKGNGIVLQAQDSLGIELMKIRDNGYVGFGVSRNVAQMTEIAGTVSANVMKAGRLIGSILSAGGSKLVVLANKNVGIGTSTPAAQFENQQIISSPTDPRTMLEKIEQRLGTTIIANLTGLSIVVTSNSLSNTFGLVGTPKTALGLNIAATQLQLHPSANAVGLRVTVPNIAVSRNAAILLGGNVGIGTTTPTASLAIVGTLRVSGPTFFTSSSAFSTTQIASFNRMVVTAGAPNINTATFKGLVTVTKNMTFANSVSLFKKLTGRVSAGGIVAGRGQIANVAVATVNRTATRFNMVGKAKFTGLLVKNTLFSNTITANAGITVTSPMIIDGAATVTHNAFTNFLSLNSIANPAQNVSEYLFTYSNQLRYRSGGVTANLSASASGVPGQLPFYDQSKSVSGNTFLNWAINNQSLVSTLNVRLMALKSTIGSAVSGVHDAQRLVLKFLDRPQNTGVVNQGDYLFAGLHVMSTGNTTVTLNETMTGLRVSVASLNAQSSTILPPDEGGSIISGQKYAATFLGGGLSIATKPTKGVVTGNASLYVNHGFTSNPAFRIDSPTSNLFAVYPGFVGIGSTTYGGRLTVTSNLEVLSGGLSRFKVTPAGQIGIGTSEPGANLHLVGSFKVTSNAVTRMMINSVGQIAFNRATSDASLRVSGDAQLGNGLWLSSGKASIGRIASTYYPLAVSGNIVSGQQIFPTNRILAWSTSANIVERAGNEVMRITDQKSLAIGTKLPSASLHVFAAAPKNIFHLSKSASPNIMVITNTGLIGLGTHLPSANLHILGKLKANRIIDRPTLLIAPNIIVTNNKTGANNFKIANQVTSGEAATGFASSIALSSDSDKSLMGLSIKLKSTVTQNNPRVVGLRVNNALFSEDANLATDDGVKYSGIFMGGNVGIGTDTPAYPLDVKSTNLNGIALNMGAIAALISSNNVSPGGAIQRGSMLIVSGNGTALKVETIPTEAFKTIAYESSGAPQGYYQVDDTKASTLMTQLKSGGIINSSYQLIPASLTALKTALGAYGNYVDGNFVSTQNVFRALAPYLQKSFISLTPTGNGAVLGQLGTITRNTIVISTGTGPLLPEINAGAAVGSKVKNAFAFTGRVGINMRKADTIQNVLDKTLVVNGDMKVGITQEGFVQDQTRLYFSGGPTIAPVVNSDNTNPMFIARHNDNVNVTSLQISVGTDAQSPTKPDAKFRVGYTQNNAFNSVFDVRVSTISQFPDHINTGLLDPASLSNDPAGFVGVGTSNAKATLHVVADKSYLDPTGTGANLINTFVTNNVSIIQNTSTAVSTNALAIQFSKVGIQVSESFNFMTFLSGPTAGFVFNADNPTNLGILDLGSIEGNAAGGIQFSSPEADYAEYLRKRDSNEVIAAGDIVGLFAGKVSKSTKGAHHFMVRSSSPIVLGNWPGQDKVKDFEPTAFLGQVAVKIDGIARPGDLILPSGKEDGKGIAVAPEKITSDMIDQIIGQAWTPSKTLVGFPFGVQVLASQLTQLDHLEAKVQTLKATNQKLKETYDAKLQERQQQIDRLKKQVQAML